MAEESEIEQAPVDASIAGADAAAAALALGAASHSARVAVEAEAYLKSQRRLSELQIERLQAQDKHFHEEAELELSHLRLRRFSGWTKATFEVALAVAAVALACFLAAAVWNAAHADGLVIESFSVPPDLAQRGLTGEVVAGELLDRLAELNQATLTSHSSKSYAASWGDEIKVEIPDTGISVAQAWRFLRRWLGHESHISGAVWHGQGGIVITARTDDKSVTIQGPDADIGGQIQKAAEAVFGLAEPYRYGVYLYDQGRHAEANAVFRRLAASGPAADRAWGFIGLARSRNGEISGHERERLYRQAVLLNPVNLTALNNLTASEQNASRLEDAYSSTRRDIDVLGRGGDSEEGGGGLSLPVMREQAQNRSRALTGAYREVASSTAATIGRGEGAVIGGLAASLIEMNIKAHDLKAARATSRDRDRPNRPADLFVFDGLSIKVLLADAEQNWPGVIAAAASLEALQKGRPGIHDLYLVHVAPLEATAEARLGHFREAEALIAATPGDCDECLLRRARIAELQGQHARADWWFARAVQDAPSIPLVYAAWGQALLERGQPDGAIAQFRIANQKGPHFADPLEGWGEALMAKNQSHLALAKFEEANKYAPNWGRLHLKWGEALIYAGRQAKARAEFAHAAGLDLTAADKAELTRFSAREG